MPWRILYSQGACDLKGMNPSRGDERPKTISCYVAVTNRVNSSFMENRRSKEKSNRKKSPARNQHRSIGQLRLLLFGGL